MESIKGSELNVPDAVFAWVLDGRGGARPLEDNDVIDNEHPYQVLPLLCPTYYTKKGIL